jgi:ElaA protein
MWAWREFNALDTPALYAALRLRNEVFVVEQQCIYQDVDGLDDRCLHLLGWQGADLHAYARLLPPGLKGPRPLIGRVIVAPAARGTGLGHELVARAVAQCEALWPGQGIGLFAQSHLQGLYGRAGFVAVGEELIEDGIPHFEMHRPPGAPS